MSAGGAAESSVINKARNAGAIDAGHQVLKNPVIKKRPTSLRSSLSQHMQAVFRGGHCRTLCRQPHLVMCSVRASQLALVLKVRRSHEKQLRFSTVMCQVRPLVKVEYQWKPQD